MNVQQKYHDLLVQAVRRRLIPNKTQESRDWFRAKALEIDSIGSKQAYIRQGKEKDSPRKRHTTKNLEIGSMYVYNYDPKWKNELPVYDTFPLIFPFRENAKYFWGINMHYLHPKQRAELMDILYTITTDKRYNHNTKLRLTWKVLKEIAKSELYAPTVHCYLKNHVKSRLKYIPPVEWDFALMLPLAKFRGPDAAKYRGH